MSPADVLAQVALAFPCESPGMTLGQGDEIDSSYQTTTLPANGDEQPTDDYLRQNISGLCHLDAQSWRCYLRYLLPYSVLHRAEEGSLVVEWTLSNLRPPNLRLATLNARQRNAVISFLNLLGFDSSSAFQAFARQVMEEYWIPNPLYPE